MSTLPTHARAVVVGGGIVGCSVAYHLAKLGFGEVVLLERHRLSAGSTWHAAGLVGQLRSAASITQLLGRSVALYQSLEAETGQATGWKMNGGLRLACNDERMAQLKRQATIGKSFGLDVHLISPAEARAMWPLMTIDDVVGAAFVPTDGAASPSDVTAALARGARMHGAKLIEETAVTGVVLKAGRGAPRVHAVETSRGRITCEVLVNACGQWARDFGRMAGVNVPLVSVEHQFMITEPIEGVTGDLPTLRDPDRLTYYKEEVGGLVMGGYERNPKPWASRPPTDFAFKLIDSDYDHFEQLAELAIGRVPALATAGVRQLLNGPEAFTPDGMFILGEAPEVSSYFVAAGFNAFGIAAAGGAGEALAQWIIGGEPPYDLWPADIRRFGRHHQDGQWVRTRTLELYGKHYTIPWPHEEHESGRPLRRSPLYETLKAKNACFGEKLGWERPNWFAPAGEAPEDRYSFGRQNWFQTVGREHRVCRERVALFDQSSFSKFLVIGRDAQAALSWICAGDVGRPTGRLTYTQLLNSRGGIECDLTVARLAPDRYYVVTGTGFATHDLHWIRSNLPDGLDAHALDVTSAYATLALMGPRSRDVLEMVATEEDVSDAAFPFGHVRQLRVAGAPVIALRVTYVGELGWELHIPAEFAKTVYDRLHDAGSTFGMIDAGYRAIESLRLEKGYRAWGADINPDHSPLVAGLGRFVRRGGPAFLGQEALQAQRAAGLPRFLCGFSCDPAVVLLGRETIYRDGQRVGWLTSGGFGYTVERGVGYGYVRHPQARLPRGWIKSGTYELEVMTERLPATLHLAPLVDPGNERVVGFSQFVPGS